MPVKFEIEFFDIDPVSVALSGEVARAWVTTLNKTKGKRGKILFHLGDNSAVLHVRREAVKDYYPDRLELIK